MSHPLASAETFTQFLSHGPSAMRVEVSAGQVIYEADDPATTFYLIESGQVRQYHVLPNGMSRLIDILGAGDWLGSAALANLPTCQRRAIATEPCIIWAISADALRIEMAKRGELAVQILESLAQRLQDAWTQATHMVFEDCRLRLIKTLLRFSTSPAAQQASDGIILRITHAQLGQAVGAARETVSVCLTELRQHNYIRTGRNKLMFNPDRLRELESSTCAMSRLAAAQKDPKALPLPKAM